MSKVLINVDFYDVVKTGLKIVRVEFGKNFTKVDIGFLYDKNRKNKIKITDNIFLSNYSEKKKLIECIGIKLNEEIKLKSVINFRYFSLKFEPFDSVKEKLMLVQSDKEAKIAIIDIRIPIKD